MNLGGGSDTSDTSSDVEMISDNRTMGKHATSLR
jgi:hypothetical protein